MILPHYVPESQAALLAGVLDSSLDGIMAMRSVRDPSGQIRDFTIEVANRRASEIVSVPVSELIGQPLLKLFPGNRTDGLFDAYCKVVETGEPFFAEHHYTHEGLNHWFSTRATPWDDGFTVSFCDITQHKAAQLEIAQARDLAQKASASKSAFLANMSHEIRTPMNAILGYADLLLDTDQTEADRRNHAQTIRRNGKHLMSIINDVLDISKIEAGKMLIESVSTAPDQLFADVMALMMPKATEKLIDLVFEAHCTLPPRITTDPTRVRQVLFNLIGNAIKFTQTGSVKVSVRSKPTSNGDLEMICEVADTGIGISEAQLAALFTPFNQADASTTRSYGGTGLGLAISKNLCQLLGGSLSCKSTVGQGSTFTASFVVGQSNQVPGKLASRSKIAGDHQVPLLGSRVLIVEDGIDNQRLIKHYLVKAGAEVGLAENGATGRDAALLALADNKPYDVILMDMQMPVLDGYSATQQLRDAGYDRPIIALTAHASVTDRQICLDCGCSNYLSKPIDRYELIRALCRSIETQVAVAANL